MKWIGKDRTRASAGRGYPLGQLSAALTTAATHEDADTRARAEERVRRWQDVLDGMAKGRLVVGSRTPVAGMPAWVTPLVVRGGFATGQPVAGGGLQPHELELARRLGVPDKRAALFAYHVTEAGIAELMATLDSGHYRVRVPEEAALLVVAWLLRAGDRSGALALLDEIGGWSDRLRFTPEPATTPPPDPTVVWRYTAGEVRDRLAATRTNPRIAAMNEALTVWNPFADKLLGLWLDTVDDGRVAATFPDGWPQRAAHLLARYRELAQWHTLCTKHRRRKENLAILRIAVEEALSEAGLSARQRGLLQHAVDAMVRRRGAPGSDAHRELRSAQARQGRRPTHAALAGVVAQRMSSLAADRGDASIMDMLGPVTPEEAHTHGVPTGTVVPEPVRRKGQRAYAGRVEDLVSAGLVPSAEVLARLVPGLAAVATAAAYDDAALRTLIAEHYRAFRARRSLLLLNLEHQVRIDELPWISALAPHRRADAIVRTGAAAALSRVGQVTLQAFPATVLPNPLVRELTTLSREAGLDVPWVEELAADIFMGTFSAKFLAAAKLAATLLQGTLYQRYYGIDADEVLAMEPTQRRWGVPTAQAFDELCLRRAGERKRGSVAANGTVIEQAQILTTHNLAVLAGPLAVVPDGGWAALARASLHTVLRLAARIHGHPRPLSTVKDAAYAWRHMLFYLSLADDAARSSFLPWAEQELAAQPGHVRTRLSRPIAGLAHVLAGGSFAPDGRAEGWAGPGPAPRRLLGWTVGRHWLLSPADR